MEIQDPATSAYVSLPTAHGFEYTPLCHLDITDHFTFQIDWTVEDAGLQILRAHVSSGTPLRLRYEGETYRGPVLMQTGLDTNDGLVMVENLRRVPLLSSFQTSVSS